MGRSEGQREAVCPMCRKGRMYVPDQANELAQAALREDRNVLALALEEIRAAVAKADRAALQANESGQAEGRIAEQQEAVRQQIERIDRLMAPVNDEERVRSYRIASGPWHQLLGLIERGGSPEEWRGRAKAAEAEVERLREAVKQMAVEADHTTRGVIARAALSTEGSEE